MTIYRYDYLLLHNLFHGLCFQRLLNVRDNIFRVFDADREADQIGRYTGLSQLLDRKSVV